MLSDRVRRLRNQLIEIQRSSMPLDDATLGLIILSIMQIEDKVLDLEELLQSVRAHEFRSSAEIIPFPSTPRR